VRSGRPPVACSGINKMSTRLFGVIMSAISVTLSTRIE
jgi:hypothetical protein